MISSSLSENAVFGTTLVPGVAHGTSFVVKREEEIVPSSEQRIDSTFFEIDRLRNSIRTVEVHLDKLHHDFLRGNLKDEADIIAVELAILQDETFFVELASQIERHHVSLEQAIELAKSHMRELFSLSCDQSNRTFELLEDVFLRLHAEVKAHSLVVSSSAQGCDRSILVAEMLWPSRATELLQQGFIGIVTKEGGRMSHAALLARSKGIPFITGFSQQDWKKLVSSQTLLLDGRQARILLNPASQSIERVVLRNERKTEQKRQNDRSTVGRTKKSSLSLLASIEYSEDMSKEEMTFADGIGLYRSEYLIQDIGYVPHEEEQVAAFSHLVELAHKRPVIIRTFDFSGDKQWVFFDSQGASFQAQPRSLSELLDTPSLFFPHMRAIVRASEAGKVSVLFPMISSLSDFRRCKSLIDAAQLSVSSEGKPVSHMKVGAMVELPSIICQLPELLNEVDFISLGTNDLLQYCLAVNRLGSISADSSFYLHEGFLALCGYIAKACKRAKKPCMVCGEMATDLGLLMVLVGLGFSSFTLPLFCIVDAKKMLLRIDRKQAKEWTKTLLALPSREERYKWLTTWKKKYG